MEIVEDLKKRYDALIHRRNQCLKRAVLSKRPDYWLDYEDQEVAFIERISQLENDKKGFQDVVKLFMDAMGGDTKGKPPWEKVETWREKAKSYDDLKDKNEKLRATLIRVLAENLLTFAEDDELWEIFKEENSESLAKLKKYFK